MIRRLLLWGMLCFPLCAHADSARLKSLYTQIRCPVCEGQSVEDSEATLAQDLRRLLLQMVRENRSDEEIRQFLVQRYGEQILLRPSFRWETVALWGFPVVILLLLLGGCTALGVFSFQRIKR